MPLSTHTSRRVESCHGVVTDTTAAIPLLDQAMPQLPGLLAPSFGHSLSLRHDTCDTPCNTSVPQPTRAAVCRLWRIHGHAAQPRNEVLLRAFLRSGRAAGARRRGVTVGKHTECHGRKTQQKCFLARVQGSTASVCGEQRRSPPSLAARSGASASPAALAPSPSSVPHTQGVTNRGKGEVLGQEPPTCSAFDRL